MDSSEQAGIACLLGIMGVVLQRGRLQNGVILGGVLFILALGCLLPAYARRSDPLLYQA